MKKFAIALVAALMSTSAFAECCGYGVPLGSNGRDDYMAPTYSTASWSPTSVWQPGYTSEGVRFPAGSPWACNGRDDGMCNLPGPSAPYVGEHYRFLYVGQ